VSLSRATVVALLAPLLLGAVVSIGMAIYALTIAR
jgi:hypothetical protein